MTPISWAMWTKSVQLGDRLLQSGQPQRHARLGQTLARLHLGEGAHVAHDAVEIVLAANQEKGLRVRRIERHPQLIEAGVGELAALLRRQHRAVGVEEHVGAALLQIAHHARQLLHQHRLADAVQHDARDVGHLVDDAGEQLPAQVRLGLEVGIGARAGGAEQIAAVGGLQVEANGIARGDRAHRLDAVVIAPRIDRGRRACDHGTHDVAPIGINGNLQGLWRHHQATRLEDCARPIRCARSPLSSSSDRQWRVHVADVASLPRLRNGLPSISSPISSRSASASSTSYQGAAGIPAARPPHIWPASGGKPAPCSTRHSGTATDAPA